MEELVSSKLGVKMSASTARLARVLLGDGNYLAPRMFAHFVLKPGLKAVVAPRAHRSCRLAVEPPIVVYFSRQTRPFRREEKRPVYFFSVVMTLPKTGKFCKRRFRVNGPFTNTKE